MCAIRERDGFVKVAESLVSDGQRAFAFVVGEVAAKSVADGKAGFARGGGSGGFCGLGCVVCGIGHWYGEWGAPRGPPTLKHCAFPSSEAASPARVFEGPLAGGVRLLTRRRFQKSVRVSVWAAGLLGGCRRCAATRWRGSLPRCFHERRAARCRSRRLRARSGGTRR